MFDYPADVYNLLRFEIRDLEKELSFLEPLVRSGGRVLDLGCGTGTVARELAKRHGARVTAIDINQDFINFAKLFKRQQSVDFSCEDITDSAKLRLLGLSTGEYDLVLCMFGVLPLLSYGNIPDFLASVRQWLKPGGAFVLDVGLYLNFVERYEPSQIHHHHDASMHVTRLIRHTILPFDGIWRHKETLLIERDGTMSTQYCEFDQILFKASELSYLLHQAGFDNLSFYSDYDGAQEFDRSSACLLIVAQH